MASDLREEVNCPICMDTLQEPVSIDCGHTFCSQCITEAGNTSNSLFQCPLCKDTVRRGMFKPNWLVMRLVEKIQAMGPTEHQPQDKELRCQRHGEKLHYFCEHEGELLCTVCREAKNHTSHRISLIEEAAQDYQVQIESQVGVLEQKEEEIIQEKVLGEQMIDDSMAWVLLEKEKALEEFKSLRQILDKEEKSFLSRLKQLEQEVAERMKQYITVTEEQLGSLRTLIDILKARLQMPPLQLLEDIQEILSWSEEFQFLNPILVPSDLVKNISETQTKHDSIIKILKNFKGPSALLLEQSSDSDWEAPGDDSLEPAESLGTDHLLGSLAPVTLDAASAHPDLVLSRDLKTVTLDLGPRGDSAGPADPERFYPEPCLLGRPGLGAGARAWEAELRGPADAACVVGVASEFAPRRGLLGLEPGAGFWVLRLSRAGCQALTEGCEAEALPVSPRKVSVRVDHDCEEVAFYDAATHCRIYTFHASFPGQVFPFFGLLAPGTRITLSP
uniref:E3 ubiquitin-protein ligase TRIM31 n=1 Tax=Jaculus jaculus TaxID=51337 RepID=UPI001E1B2DF7|nr:E3 ubiquitin-protein ligase TRIM31 [Jaculus jaculus]